MMNRATGRRTTAADHLRQSVADIITTPIGSRVMRRDTDHASRGTLYIDASVRAIGRAQPIALEVRL